jgi:membrane protein DedA with SNARE-associated domain
MDSLLPILSRYGYGILLLGALVEGETIVVLAGVLAQQAVLAYPWAVSVAAVGAVAGDQAWFYLGRHFGPEVLTRFPRLARRLDVARPWVQEKADWIAAASRFIYGTRIASPMLLGAHGYAAARFLVINVVAGTVWAVLAVTAGYLLGAGAEELLGDVARLEWLAITVVIGIFGWRRFRRAKSPTKSRA